jgi:hypothetical protein
MRPSSAQRSEWIFAVGEIELETLNAEQVQRSKSRIQSSNLIQQKVKYFRSYTYRASILVAN